MDSAGLMKVALLRSGRHLHVGVRTLRGRWPDCRLMVVSQPGAESVLDELGIPQEDRFIYSRKKIFTPLSVALSPVGVRLRSLGFDRVAVLWNDPDGKGHENVSRTALLLSPRGFLAITPDGSVVEQDIWHLLKRETQRAFCSIAAFCVIQLFLCLPAALLRLCVRR